MKFGFQQLFAVVLTLIDTVLKRKLLLEPLDWDYGQQIRQWHHSIDKGK